MNKFSTVRDACIQYGRERGLKESEVGFLAYIDDQLSDINNTKIYLTHYQDVEIDGQKYMLFNAFEYRGI